MPSPTLETVITAATCTNLTHLTEPKIPPNPNQMEAKIVCHHLQVGADSLQAQQLLKSRLVLVAKTVRCECLLAEVVERFSSFVTSECDMRESILSVLYFKTKRIVVLTQIRTKFYIASSEPPRPPQPLL